MAINNCPLCLTKQREIDRLTEELARLKQKLRYQERKAAQGFFGSSTPSAQVPVKANTTPREPKPKGARPGHPGNGRKSFAAGDADQVVEVAAEHENCPECGGPLRDKGQEERSVVEAPPLKAQLRVYRLPKKYCPQCRRTFIPKAPGVLPKSLYGNQLIANAAVLHYGQGMPQGRVCQMTGLSNGALTEIFHRLARLFAAVPPKLIQEYKKDPAKHADETGWRTNGKNGYAWLFATQQLSIFLFGKNRSAAVPQELFGKNQSPGVLVVDRYSGYNQVPCALQYCYAHLLREVQNLEKEFPAEGEIQTFVATVAPLLAKAMSLKQKKISNTRFYAQAKKLKAKIKAAMKAPAKHLAIRRIQDIFREHANRLYHWAHDRRVPAHNNLAERDLRPSVIARKVSFGSNSTAGANTRSILTTILQTLKKRGRDPNLYLKQTLDQLAHHPKRDPYHLLFRTPGPE
jgi:transposase